MRLLKLTFVDDLRFPPPPREAPKPEVKSEEPAPVPTTHSGPEVEHPTEDPHTKP